MKAIAVNPVERKLEMLSMPKPKIMHGDQVELRTIEVGICGTDREICSYSYGTPPIGEKTLVLGHEALGQVTSIGDCVTGLNVGDFVVPSVRRPCQHSECNPCAETRQDYCYTGNFTERGIKEAHGFMAEYFVEEERYLHKIPETLRDVAVLVEPLSIAEKAISQIWQVQKRLPWDGPSGSNNGQGKNAVVLGAGPIGILGAMALRVRGFRTFLYSRRSSPNYKATLCNAFGATYVSSTQMAVGDLAEEIGSIDVVYEAMGVAELSFAVLRALGVNGVFVFTGIPSHKPAIPIHADSIMRDLVLKNQAIIGTVNADRDAFENAIADLHAFKSLWPDAIEQVVTGRFPLSSYRALLLNRSVGIKDVIAMDAAQ
ncbi:MAG: glucose 1-dehydrogenase [Sterolibacterium sp.]